LASEVNLKKGFNFLPATKASVKPVGLFEGPTGSGKTLGSLHLLHLLVPEKRIAVIDTERYRASEYAGHKMDDGTVLDRYDTLATDDYSPGWLCDAIEHVQSNPAWGGLLVDSYSHFWAGPGGMSEIGSVGGWPDGWRKVGVWEKKIQDLLLNNKIATWVTSRVKMDYEMEKDEQTGRKMVKKMGLKPIIRDTFEYEFSFVGRYLDTDGNIVFDKASNITQLKTGGPFRYQMDVVAAYINSWLSDGEPVRIVDGKYVHYEMANLSDAAIKTIRFIRTGRGPEKESVLSASIASIQELGLDGTAIISAIGGGIWNSGMAEKLSMLLNKSAQTTLQILPEALLLNQE
jgi:hypothetical protein